MYIIYADDSVIYHPSVDELRITKGSISHEVNKSSSFTFTLQPTHPYYDKLNKYKTIIRVKKNSETIFRGRIINDSYDFRKAKSFTCEGELSFLLDSIQRPFEFQGSPKELFTKFITEHNSQVDADKQFAVGEITVEDPNDYINRSYTEYKDTFTNINEKLINTLGGYLHITRGTNDKPILNYLADFPYLSNQKIEFGENLLDFTRTDKGDSIITALIPLGAKPEGEETRITIKDVNDGKDYVYDQAAVETYGWIFGTQTWDDVTEPSNLLRKAKESLAEQIKQNITIDLSAADLSLMDKSIGSFHVGDYVEIVSKPHGIDAKYLLKKQSIDLLRPDNDKISLGYTYSSFTDDTLHNNNQNGNIIERIEIIISDYEVNKPMIEEITNRLVVEVSRNHPLSQSYNPNTGSYTPDYTAQPLVLTPTGKYRGAPVNCTWVWKRIENGKELALETGETVSSTGVLTIKKNFGTAYRVYRCYATYKADKISLVASLDVEFNKIDDGKTGATGSPGKDAAIQSDTEPEDKTQLWLDTSVDPPLLKQWNGEEWVIVNDQSEIIQDLRQELISSIEQTSTDIRMEVAENYYLKDETDQLINSVSTQYEQTSEHFEFKFTEFEKMIGDLDSTTSDQFKEILKYIRFVDGNIILGEVGNEVTLKIQNDRISFLQNDVEVMYITKNKINITDGEFINSLTLGNFAFIPRKNGNLSFKKVR